MKIRIATIILFIFINISKADSQSAPNTLTLKQCVDIAFTDNLQVKQNVLQVQNAAINLKQSKINQLPALVANLGHGINQGRSIDPFTNSYVNQSIFYGNYNLGTGITLFSGAQLKNLIKENGLNYEAGKMDLQTTKDNLTLNIILAYVGVLNNQDQLEQSGNQAVLTKKQIDRLEILNKEGAIIPSQLYELKGQLGNDQLAVINNQNAVDAAKLALCQLLNIPFDKNIQLQQITADEYVLNNDADPDKIYATALTQLAQIKSADFKKQSAQKAVAVARGEFYPQVGLGANIYTNYSSAAKRDIFLSMVQVPSGDFVNLNGSQVPVITSKSNFNTEKINYFNQFNNNYSTSVSLNMRIPLFNATQARSRVALAKNELLNTQYIEETAKINLKQSIEQAYFNMTAANEKFKILVQQVSDFTEAFRIAEVRFNSGISSEIEYLIAKNNLDRAKINFIDIKYDFIFRIKILDYYQGRLVL